MNSTEIPVLFFWIDSILCIYNYLSAIYDCLLRTDICERTQNKAEKRKFSEENEYNLNIPRYVDIFKEEKPVDMDAVKENIKIELEEVEKQMQKYLNELGL